jgi:hypothetical protein
MKKVVYVLFVVVLISFSCVAFAQESPAAPVDPAPSSTVAEPFAQIDGLVENMLKAFNDQDSKAFYVDFAKAMAAIATEQAFKTLYTDMYMAQYGKYVSRKLVTEKSVVTDDATVGLVVYSAVFEKNEKIQISVNVMREEGNWKLMQVQFGPEQ